MRRIIDGVLYDTGKAKEMGRRTRGPLDRDTHRSEEILCRSPRGRWFVHGSGGAATCWAESDWGAQALGEGIALLSEDEARRWLRGSEPEGDEAPDVIHGVDGARDWTATVVEVAASPDDETLWRWEEEESWFLADAVGFHELDVHDVEEFLARDDVEEVSDPERLESVAAWETEIPDTDFGYRGEWLLQGAGEWWILSDADGKYIDHVEDEQAREWLESHGSIEKYCEHFAPEEA